MALQADNLRGLLGLRIDRIPKPHGLESCGALRTERILKLMRMFSCRLDILKDSWRSRRALEGEVYMYE